MRTSGILMHITSLPGPYGVGTLGKNAYSFVDFLEEAGQSYWQILPLTPTGYGDSPYQSCSTFAGNHYLIDLDALVEEGLLKPEEIQDITWSVREDKADFGLLYNSRLKVLRLAYSRFQGGPEYDAFRAENDSWLPDFTLFMALKDHFAGKPWYSWEKAYKFREESAMESARREFRQDCDFYAFVQYLFFTQWNALRTYAAGKGIRFIGDVPIYVPLDSVEVWSSPDHGRGRCPPGCLHCRRPALGQSSLPLGRDGAGWIQLVDPPPERRRKMVRHGPSGPFPGL